MNADDTLDFDKAKIRLWNDRIADNGYLLESIVERDDSDLGKLGYWITHNQTAAFTVNIGATITKWVTDYCEPGADEVVAEMIIQKMMAGDLK